jgi:hypothetical protein
MRQIETARIGATPRRCPGPSGAHPSRDPANAPAQRRCGTACACARPREVARDSGSVCRSSSLRSCGPTALPAQAVSRWTRDVFSFKLRGSGTVDRPGEIGARERASEVRAGCGFGLAGNLSRAEGTARVTNRVTNGVPPRSPECRRVTENPGNPWLRDT